MKANKTIFLTLLIASMLIWGLSWSSAKVLSSYGSPSITFLRFILVPLTLFPILKSMRIPVSIKRTGGSSALLAGALMVCYTLCFFAGLQRGKAGSGGVLVTVSIPIFAYLISLMLDKKIPNKKALFGLTLGAIGGSLLLNLWTDYQMIFLFGNGFFLMAAAIWAAMSKVTSKSGQFGNPIAFNFWLHLIAIVGLLFFVDFTEINSILQNGDYIFWGNLLYFGIVNSSIATTTYFVATSKIGAERSSSFYLHCSHFSIVFLLLIMDESITWNVIVGGILALVAVFVINKS